MRPVKQKYAPEVSKMKVKLLVLCFFALSLVACTATQSPPEITTDETASDVASVEQITWEKAQELVLGGQVEQVVQSHDLQVELELKDGRRFSTIEPELDAIFQVIKQCGDPCSSIDLITE